jgi:hypothetical protein
MVQLIVLEEAENIHCFDELFWRPYDWFCDIEGPESATRGNLYALPQTCRTEHLLGGSSVFAQTKKIGCRWQSFKTLDMQWCFSSFEYFAASAVIVVKNCRFMYPVEPSRTLFWIHGIFGNREEHDRVCWAFLCRNIGREDLWNIQTTGQEAFYTASSPSQTSARMWDSHCHYSSSQTSFMPCSSNLQLRQQVSMCPLNLVFAIKTLRSKKVEHIPHTPTLLSQRHRISRR